MLPDQKVEVTWVHRTKKYYEGKGYIYTKQFDKFMADVKDLQFNSHVIVQVQCDYCGKLHPKKYQKYNEGHININKDCCFDCSSEKNKEVNLLLYNVENQFQRQEVKEKSILTLQAHYGIEGIINVQQIPEIKEKTKQTFIDRFGVDNPTKNIGVLEKRVNTLLDRFGVTSPSKNPIVMKKVRLTMMERYGVEHSMQDADMMQRAMITRMKNMYESGTNVSSKQQRYICNILLGKLNYPETMFPLDIAFPESKIYIEYDGSGHDLSIKLNNITQEEFDKKEIKRYYFLKNKNWKMIRIISGKDWIPSDDIITYMFKFAREYLNTGHSWIKFNIDNNTVENNKGVENFDFGELRILKSI